MLNILVAIIYSKDHNNPKFKIKKKIASSVWNVYFKIYLQISWNAINIQQKTQAYFCVDFRTSSGTMMVRNSSGQQQVYLARPSGGRIVMRQASAGSKADPASCSSQPQSRQVRWTPATHWQRVGLCTLPLSYQQHALPISTPITEGIMLIFHVTPSNRN